MSTHRCNIAIIGGGVIGTSVAYQLSNRRFNDVILIDSERSITSATAHSGGMMRSIHESPHHTSLAVKSGLQLNELLNSGELTIPYHSNGSLYFIHKRRLGDYQKSLDVLKSSNTPFSLLDALEGSKQFPHLIWNEQEIAIWEPGGGQIDSKDFSSALLNSASIHGLNIFENTNVVSIAHVQNRFHIASQDQIFIANALVLAGGARFKPLLKKFGLESQCSVKDIETYLTDQSNETNSWPNIFHRETMEFAGFSNPHKVTLSAPHLAILPQLHSEMSMTCVKHADLYTQGRKGLLGEVPGFPGLFVATGWGGTGVKFALEVGNQMASLMEELKIDRTQNYASII